ncbi:MAG: DinB family protein, partial [Anaerolineae bacterium]
MTKRRIKDRAAFLQCEGDVWAELNAAVADIPPDMMLQPGVAGHWSLKDVLAHLAAWMEETLRVLPRLVEGEEVELGYTIESFNARHYEADRDRPLSAVQARLERVRRELLALLETVPEELLLRHRRINEWAVYSTYGHYEEHLPDILRFKQGLEERDYEER